MNDDAELLRRYAEEASEASFTELVQRHLALVYYAALRQCGGDVHRAQDVAQLVFADLARKARTLSRRPSLVGWLYTSTRYAAAHAVRSESRRQAREQEVFRMSETHEQHPEMVADWDSLRPVIDEALYSLGERDREAVLLRFFEGKGFADVGAVLATSEDAARMRVERALEKLRLQLSRHGITSTASALGLALTQQAGAALPAGLATAVSGSAMASAGAVSGAVLGWAAFMSTKKAVAGVLIALAGVMALNVVQQQANATLTREVHALAREGEGVNQVVRGVAGQTSNPEGPIGDAAELARLREEAAALRKKIDSRRNALTNGGILRVGNREITRDTSAKEKLDIMYHDRLSTPFATWQVLLEVARISAGDSRTSHGFVDSEMLALMLCLDEPARGRVRSFLAALPQEARNKYTSAEHLLASVFGQWLWKEGWPQRFSAAGKDTYIANDPTLAYTSWQITDESGQWKVERYMFKRFDDGWRYGPLSEVYVEQMLALLDPATGTPKVQREGAR